MYICTRFERDGTEMYFEYKVGEVQIKLITDDG